MPASKGACVIESQLPLLPVGRGFFGKNGKIDEKIQTLAKRTNPVCDVQSSELTDLSIESDVTDRKSRLASYTTSLVFNC